VRDRLLHHAIYRTLYPFFDKTFIADSYSCRNNKGTHRAINKFRGYFYKVSGNNTRAVWVLQCDIKKFFASIDHNILIKILREYIPDQNIGELLNNIISSFSSQDGENIGLPLGNLTSQLFVNVYMNKFDQFVKHKLKARYYIRYADDFVILSENKKWLEKQVLIIRKFLWDELKLGLHPDKIFIKTVSSGIDFLGLINFPNYRILRNQTKKRIIRKMQEKYQYWQNGLISKKSFEQSWQSYLGVLEHCNAHSVFGTIEAAINYEAFCNSKNNALR